MSADVVVLVLSSAAALVAVALVVTPPPEPAPGRTLEFTAVGRRAVVAVVAAAVVLAFTGWTIPAVVAGSAAFAATGAWQRRDRRRVDDVERTEALASWIENLRDVLIAGDQPIGAVTATVSTCPTVIRPQVRRLAAGLGRQEPDLVVRRFADEIDDPLGDLVAAGLLIAVERGARTAAVLTSLADQARQQADRRKLVEAERAPVQREVRLLAATMGSLVAGLFVFARADYLAPYDTPTGQLFLGTVLAIYVALLLRVQRLARYPGPRRFLAGARVERGGS